MVRESALFRWLWTTLVVVCGVALGSAQPIIWSTDVSLETQPKLVRDASSSIYQTTLAVTTQTAYLVGRKFDRNGNLIWSEWVDLDTTSGGGVGLANVALRANSTRAYALVGVDEQSLRSVKVVSFDLATGASMVKEPFDVDFAMALAVNEAHLALVSRNDVNFFVQYLNPSTLAEGNRAVTTTELSLTSVLEMDAQGNCYTASIGITNPPLLAKVTPSGAVSWSRFLDDAGLTNEFVISLDVDTVQNRVFVGAYGKLSNVDTPLIGVYSASTGAQFYLGNRSGASSGRNVSVEARSGGGAYVLEGPTGRMMRIDSIGKLVWLSPTFTVTSFGRDPIQFDVDGNLAVTYALSSAAGNVRRVSSANGSLIQVFGFSRPTGSAVRSAVVDSAGSSYVAIEASGFSRLMRVQSADLQLPASPSTGGKTVVGRIALSTNASSLQTWQMTSSNPSVASVPPQVLVGVGELGVDFPITTVPVPANTTVSIFARYMGLVVAKVLTVVAPTLKSLGVSPTVVVGGNPMNGSVTLEGFAPAGGRVVSLSVDKPAVASVPASVTVTAGSPAAAFAITTFAVNANQGVVVSATLGAVTRTRFVAVNAPSLTQIAVDPPSVQGGLPTTLTLTINGIAPVGGLSIILISGAPGIVLVPGTGAVPAGQTSGGIAISTNVVSSSTPVTLFATRAGIYRTTTLTVTP